MNKVFPGLFGLFLFVTSGFAQQAPSPQPATPDAPRAEVSEVKKVPGGGVLFAVRLHASKTKALDLSRPPARRKPGATPEEGDNDPLPFSLAESTLVDVYSGKVYKALPLLPMDPYVGPMEVLSGINPGGWIQLGVAFPALPPPPEKDGKKQPYQLVFAVPELKLQTKILLDPETLEPKENPAPM